MRRPAAVGTLFASTGSDLRVRCAYRLAQSRVPLPVRNHGSDYANRMSRSSALLR